MRGLLVTALAAAAAGSASAATAPLLLLRSGPELAVEATKSVSYETLKPAKVLAGVLGGGVVGQWQAGSPKLVAVLLLQPDQALSELQSAVDSAASSFALPHVSPLPSTELAAQLAAELAFARASGGQMGELLVADTCPQEVRDASLGLVVPGEPRTLGEWLRGTLGSSQTAPTVLLACPGAEAGALHELRGVLDAAAEGSEYLVVAAPTAAPRPLLSASSGRSLLTLSSTPQQCYGASPLCDCVCVAQTSLIMFSIVFGLFTILALSGICCLHALEGPGRFELSNEQKHGGAQ